MWAISGTSGSSGLGSVNSEQIESSTCTIEHTVDPLTWQQEDPGRLITSTKPCCAQHTTAGLWGQVVGWAHKVQTLDTVRAGLHCSFSMSRHIEPLELMLGWYTFVWKLTCTNDMPSTSGTGFALAGRAACYTNVQA